MNEILESHARLIEKKISDFVPKTNPDYDIIGKAMLYSLESGGKRVRPVLTLEFCRISGGDVQKAVPFATAVEFIHTYSLIHDDLPCMDNDDFRRGKPSSHIQFGEANALLAGDALLTHAFSCLVSSELPPECIVSAVKYLSASAGANGMIGGQVVDLIGENRDFGEDELFLMDRLKTSALIKAACVLGCIAAGNSANIPFAEEFAENLGLAFQIVDDILDFLEGGGSDAASGKSTYVSLMGLDGAKRAADKYTSASLLALNKIDGDTSVLSSFASELLKRTS